LDENGEPVENSYTLNVKDSDSDYAKSIYAPAWFTRFANGITGIFKFKNGKYSFTKNGKETLDNTISDLKKIHDHIFL
jgi:hypothetical protein